MISICHITLANAHNGPFVAVIIQVEHLGRRSSSGRLPHNPKTCGVPDKVLRPPIAAWIEEWNDLLRLWITACQVIPTTFVAVAAGQGQVVGVIRAPSRLGQHMVDGEAHELPAFIGMAILTAALRSLVHNTPRSRGNGHAGLNGCARCVSGD
jgi:hypothetical protein